MRYVDFKEAVRSALITRPDGLTWKELRDCLGLPYRVPCPEWVGRLEEDIGLRRNEKKGRALLWKLQKREDHDQE